MCLHPFIVRPDRSEQLLEVEIEIILLSEIDPIQGAKLGRNCVALDRASHYRDQSLAIADSMIKLALADREIG